ncbi:MAG TPA: hypothetical protein VF157_04260, partial [Chloroflexota bacterium]
LQWELGRLDRLIAAEREQQRALRGQAGELAGSLAEVEQLKTVRELARAAGEGLVGIEQEQDEIERGQAELAELRAAAGRLPELEAELERLERLAAKLAELAALEAAQADRRRNLEQLAQAADRVAELRASTVERRQALSDSQAALAHARAEAAAAEAAERSQRRAELLQAWLQMREVAHVVEQGERELLLFRQQLTAFDQQVAEFASQRQVKQWTAFGLAIAALLSLGLSVGLAARVPAALAGLLLAAVLAAGCWFFGRGARRAARELTATEAAAKSVRADVNRLEGEHALAQRTGQDPSRLADIESELASLGGDVPSSVQAAQELLSAARDLPANREGARGASEARQRLGELEGRRQALEAELDQLRSQLEHAGDPEAARLALQTEIERCESDIAGFRQALPREAGSEMDARELAATARAATHAARDSGNKVSELETALAGRLERLANRQAEFAAAWAQLCELRPEAQPRVDACRALWRDTGDQLAALDEPQLRAQAAELERALAASEERARAAERRGAEIEQELAALAPLTPLTPMNEEELDSRQAALEDEQRELLGRVRSLKDQEVALEQQLGLAGAELEQAEAQRDLAAFEERLQVRKQAYRIVGLARRTIVSKVLPSTIRNMGLLLPLLTSDRYRDVDIDAETYKIKVWDELARGMKAKDIFSGGTRDQFSLALRLAFALATLPEERGTAPGFIFLDEPLSSFDSVRGDALVNLLTRGPVADSFDQIFVISHSRAFDEQLFDYHLQLEGGTIVSSDLPRLEAAPAVAAPQMPLELAAAR